MKKLSKLFAGLFFLVVSLNVNAQTQPVEDYFIGQWEVAVEGTPQDNGGKMKISLERKEGKLAGTILPKEGADSVKITKIEEKEKSVTLYFTTGGYNVYLMLEKKDDDNATGSVLDMYDAKAVRVKETAKQ